MHNRLRYEEIQTVLLEMEVIIDNRPLTHLYSDITETQLTTNLLIFARMLSHSRSNDQFINNQVFVEIKIQKLTHLMEQFWERWRKEPQ